MFIHLNTINQKENYPCNAILSDYMFESEKEIMSNEYFKLLHIFLKLWMS